MALIAFVKFCFLNYLRQHRYLLDLVVIVIFSIIFGGFLTSDQLGDSIWLIFSIFALIINIPTALLTFFLEKGNTLYFLLSKPKGRENFLYAKIIVIVLIDLFWVIIFALLFGLRFPSVDYFLLLPSRFSLILITLVLSTLIISFAYAYQAHLIWLIFILFVFGNIIRKEGFFPIESAIESFKVLVFLLPPFFEMHFLTISLDFSGWPLVFLGAALAQIIILFYVSRKRMMRKDFV